MQGELNAGRLMWGWGLMQGELNVGVGLNAERVHCGWGSM